MCRWPAALARLAMLIAPMTATAAFHVGRLVSRVHGPRIDGVHLDTTMVSWRFFSASPCQLCAWCSPYSSAPAWAPWRADASLEDLDGAWAPPLLSPPDVIPATAPPTD